jgi:hypothetical protein
VQSVVELISGRDYITGEKTSRAWAAAGIVVGLVGLKGVLKAATKADDIVDGARRLASRTCCFVAGTLVATDRGVRPIEEIEVGDLVLSRDEYTGETAYKPVTNVISRHDREIWDVSFAVSQDGEITTATFETTDDHPWRTSDRGWLKTGELTPGVEIQRAEGAPAKVVWVAQTGRTAVTFNLQVAEFQSYFVGEAGIWVHNCDLGNTGTVWDSIKATQGVWSGTSIPRSFELAAGNARVWVHGNATEHLAEYATAMANRGVSPDLVRVATQQQLQSLQAAVAAATANGTVFNQVVKIGGWELIFAAPRAAGQLPALIHALPTP